MKVKSVLSLFHGMGCCNLALERAGIDFDHLYTSEVDRYATIVDKANNPKNISLGDVKKWREWGIDWSEIDLLIGGSPCQGFSFAGKQLAFDDPRSALFFEYLNILNHIKSLNPDVKFLLENVKMKKEYLDVITSMLKVEPVLIDSALVSAQSRKRYYWANWEFGQPKDKGVLLSHIINSDEADINSEDWHKWWSEKKELQLKKKYSAIVNNGTTDKAITMTARQYANWNGNFAIVQKPRGNNPGGVRAIDGKAPSMTACSREDNNHLAKNIKSGARRSRGDETRSDEKANTLLADGHQSRWLSKDDIFYRKLTPVECERLQTVPNNYTNHVSNSQRYKMLGNGWTVDVIAHIFRSM